MLHFLFGLAHSHVIRQNYEQLTLELTLQLPGDLDLEKKVKRLSKFSMQHAAATALASPVSKLNSTQSKCFKAVNDNN